jgi:hypothetical protein
MAVTSIAQVWVPQGVSTCRGLTSLCRPLCQPKHRHKGHDGPRVAQSKYEQACQRPSEEPSPLLQRVYIISAVYQLR